MSRVSRTALRVAAVVAVLVGGATVWLARPSSAVVFVAGPGVPAAHRLPDGSQLTLAPGSRAELSRGFGSESREVRLTGAGYFDVVHDDARPFRVRAGGGVAEDIGTRFVVRAWPELRTIDVAVEEGIVALNDSATATQVRGTELVAGQRGRLRADGTVEVTPVAAGEFDWLQGNLVFDGAPLSEALAELGRWFDVELRADAVLADRRLSARFRAESLPQVLDALALALDVQVRHEGRVITLLPR
ncbi:MAG: FecR family protein [Gemmatimonadaceae bacterium]